MESPLVSKFLDFLGTFLKKSLSRVWDVAPEEEGVRAGHLKMAVVKGFYFCKRAKMYLQDCKYLFSIS